MARRKGLANPADKDYPANMHTWNDCPEIERIADKVSGVWLFKGTRVPVRALFENVEDGASVDEFLEWFPGVRRQQVASVLSFSAKGLEPSPSA